MSASGYKRTFRTPKDYVRFTPNSGHSRRWMGGETNAYQECPVSVRWTFRRPIGIWFGYRISSIIVADQIP
jgi:hypothetical protein